MKQKLDVLQVLWVDAKSSDPWESVEEAENRWNKLHLVVSIGAAVSKTKDHVVLCQNFGDGDVSGWISIPTLWIKRVRKLGVIDLNWVK